jgi:hypothetical protein
MNIIMGLQECWTGYRASVGVESVSTEYVGAIECPSSLSLVARAVTGAGSTHIGVLHPV